MEYPEDEYTYEDAVAEYTRYGAYEVHVNDEYYEILCESCWNEAYYCFFCDDGELYWTDDGYYCEYIGGTTHPDHEECRTEAHADLDQECFDEDGDCWECGHNGVSLRHAIPLVQPRISLT